MPKHALRPLCTQRACTMNYILVQYLRNHTIVLVRCAIPVDCSVLKFKRISLKFIYNRSSVA